MGCVPSKKDINDLHPNIFQVLSGSQGELAVSQVMNVDQIGRKISPGQLEITDTDLVLYQRKKPPVKWPLRRLRRYGFEGEIFSFESGRRCPTGQGIYAFHCLRAEQLFNLVQGHIQVRNIIGEDGVSREFPAIGPVVPIRVNIPSTSGEPNYLEPMPFYRGNAQANNHVVSQNGGSIHRLGSVRSNNGPLSPLGTSPSPPPIHAPCLPSITSHTISNTLTNYANEELFATAPQPPAPAIESSGHCITNQQQNQRTYMNRPSASVVSTESADEQSEAQTIKEDNIAMSAYVNVDLGQCTAPLSPDCDEDEEEPNYARLDIGAEVQPCHLYMNIVPGQDNGGSMLDKPLAFPKPFDRLQEETRHCYANLEPNEIEVARSHLPNRLSGSERYLPHISSATSPPHSSVRQVNYIVLDLDKTKADINVQGQQPQTTPVSSLPAPDIHGRVSEGYATIDFNKTVALSHSVNPNVDNDSEGSRKTRHNSTINDLAIPFD